MVPAARCPPVCGGPGIGQRLLSANLEREDATGAPAYPDAGDELVRLYERFGFGVRTRFEPAGGPTVNGMWRQPGASSPG